ncbi:MAG: hypothetical protein ABI162_07800 [Luteolibacter sp.]
MKIREREKDRETGESSESLKTKLQQLFAIPKIRLIREIRGAFNFGSSSQNLRANHVGGQRIERDIGSSIWRKMAGCLCGKNGRDVHFPYFLFPAVVAG